MTAYEYHAQQRKGLARKVNAHELMIKHPVFAGASRNRVQCFIHQMFNPVSTLNIV